MRDVVSAPMTSTLRYCPDSTNAAATAKWDADKGELTLEYHGIRILSATVTAENADGKSSSPKIQKNYAG